MHLTSALIWLAPLLVVGHAGKHGKPWKRQDEELDVGKKTRRRALGSRQFCHNPSDLGFC